MWVRGSGVFWSEGEGAGGFAGEEDLGAAFGLLVEAVEEDGGGFGFGFEADGGGGSGGGALGFAGGEEVDFGGGVGEGAVGGAVDGFELPGEVGGGLVVEEEGEGGLDVGEGVGEGLGFGFGGLVAEPGGGDGGKGGGVFGEEESGVEVDAEGELAFLGEVGFDGEGGDLVGVGEGGEEEGGEEGEGCWGWGGKRLIWRGLRREEGRWGAGWVIGGDGEGVPNSSNFCR